MHDQVIPNILNVANYSHLIWLAYGLFLCHFHSETKSKLLTSLRCLWKDLQQMSDIPKWVTSSQHKINFISASLVLYVTKQMSNALQLLASLFFVFYDEGFPETLAAKQACIITYPPFLFYSRHEQLCHTHSLFHTKPICGAHCSKARLWSHLIEPHISSWKPSGIEQTLGRKI